VTKVDLFLVFENAAEVSNRLRERMTVYQIDPIRDLRWAQLVERHPLATVFHTPEWLEALRRTYGYRPVVLTTTESGQPLRNGLVLCNISSWLTGSRMVSLPFSDHCQPLVDDPADLIELVKSLEGRVDGKNCKYAELRPLQAFDSEMEKNSHIALSESYCFHMLDLRPPLDVLFKNFHKSCVQRKLQRAKREELRIEEGRSDSLLTDFYRLMVLTRRRHRLPPQPLEWFRNLIECLGERVSLWVAYKDNSPVASIFTLTFKNTVVYKYGCSDPAFNNLGGTLALFWHAIQSAKERGLREFDFGRSELDNEGLISFKDHWGSTRTTLRYYRYPACFQKSLLGSRPMELAQWAFSYLPDFCLTLVGKLLYRHIG